MRGLRLLRLQSISLILSVFILLFPSCWPWNLRGSERGVSKAVVSGHVETLVELLDRDRQVNDKAYDTAIQYLNDMETKPTCDRTATALLITSCQAADGSGERSAKDRDQLLALLKDVYATRLALCELERAGTLTPSDCSHIVDFSLKHDEAARPEHLSRTYLEPCTRALYRNQQQWTSYSNNRQKASLTCHAARIDVEKDAMIEHARKLANNTASLKDALTQTLLQHDRRVRQQEEFAKRVEAFHVRIIDGVDTFSNSLTFRLDDIMAEIGRTFSQKAEHMVKAFSSSESSAAVLREALQRASSDLANIVRLHQKMNSDILSHRAESASKEKAFQEANRDLAVQTKQSLKEVNRGEIVSLIGAINSIASKTEILSTAIHVLKTGQDQLRQSLEATNIRIQQDALYTETQFATIHANTNRTLEEQEAAHISMRNLSLALKEVALTAQAAARSLEIALPLFSVFDSFTNLLSTTRYPIYFVLIVILFALIRYVRSIAHDATNFVLLR